MARRVSIRGFATRGTDERAGAQYAVIAKDGAVYFARSAAERDDWIEDYGDQIRLVYPAKDYDMIRAGLNKIGRRMGFSTLETRMSDRHDFQEIGVWSARDALHQAFTLGLERGLLEAGD